jgi:1-acyl-sn-glycerol-3-phosphate acyltransferase
LDFALNFFALGMIRKADLSSPGATRHLRPRFIAAKDHLIDNPLIYSWISLGKVIENAGMIFIDRKKGKGWAAMEEAAKKLVTSDVEIAVYPQGTRAYFMQSASGERIDAGYYTTFTKKNWDQPLGHLKSGTSYLILDTLIELQKRGEEKFNVLVSGIVGSAIAGPKGSFKIQTQTEIEFRLAPLWVLSTHLAKGIRRPAGAQPEGPEEELYLKRQEEIQQGINQHLLQALNWHELLIERMERELEKLDLPEQEIAAAVAWLKMSNAEGQALPFILIDRILALKPELWKRFFRLFLSLIGERPEGASWTALLQEVSERLKTR